ncbi:MAG: TetR/AcrR family transcriptional regulator [Devosia sp.]
MTAEISGGATRERKRRDTERRITEAAIRLFGKHGYEATTLDAIAEAAGISRRTFFHYFKSKDEVLLSMQRGLGEMLVAALAQQPAELRPLEATRNALLGLSAPYPQQDLLAIDKLMRSSEAVQARKQASYVRAEQMLYAALAQRWPDPEPQLRLVALLTIGAMRLSLDAFSRSEGTRPIAELLRESFDAMRSL